MKWRIAAGSEFDASMTSVENVIQTLRHEVGHHKGLKHGLDMQDAEYQTINRVRLLGR